MSSFLSDDIDLWVYDESDNFLGYIQSGNIIDSPKIITTTGSTKDYEGEYEYMNFGEGNISLSVSYVPEKPKAERIIFNGRRTIVFWNDGTKTVVNARKGDEFSKEVGFAMSYVKKFGTGRGDFERLLEEAHVQEQKKKEDKVRK